MSEQYKLFTGECLPILRTMEDNSIDAIVTDPPAGIAFMGKEWDKDKGGKRLWIAWMQEIATECLRVLKPGGHALVWALPRTSHWTADAWEEAGWQVRDKVYHAFGSGFPKSLDIGKAIDKAAGVEREVVGVVKKTPSASANCNEGWVRPWAEGKTTMNITAPATPEAQEWDGWGTALKPAVEEWLLFRKPFQGTVAGNVLEWGVGGLNVDKCRVGTDEDTRRNAMGGENGLHGSSTFKIRERRADEKEQPSGRFPAHLTHDGSDEVLGAFPVTKSGFMAAGTKRQNSDSIGKNTYGHINPDNVFNDTYGDSGSAARFFQSCPLDREDIEARRLFYQAKASKQDRDDGLEGFEKKRTGGMIATENGSMLTGSGNERTTARCNTHPTVKATPLMRWLCRLITPPGGTVLDPFCGSGSTGKGCMLEGFRFIGIDLSEENTDIAKARIEYGITVKAEEDEQKRLEASQLKLF